MNNIYTRESGFSFKKTYRNFLGKVDWGPVEKFCKGRSEGYFGFETSVVLLVTGGQNCVWRVENNIKGVIS